MPDPNDKTILAIGLLSLLGLVLFGFNAWFLFGLITWSMMALAVAVGYGPEKKTKPVFYTLLGMTLVYWALFAGIAWAHGAEGEPALLLGLPLSTAFLVYGIWPVGTIWGVLYFFVFGRSVLPPKRLEEFTARFGQRK